MKTFQEYLDETNKEELSKLLKDFKPDITGQSALNYKITYDSGNSAYEIDGTDAASTLLYGFDRHTYAFTLDGLTSSTAINIHTGSTTSLLTSKIVHIDEDGTESTTQASGGYSAGTIYITFDEATRISEVSSNFSIEWDPMIRISSFSLKIKIMEDKIGMALAANRISICYFNLKNYQKSLEYILINIKLSDNDNLYSGVYNIGIIYRSLE